LPAVRQKPLQPELRVLLDEKSPRRLLWLFGSEVRATTVGRHSWSGTKNGELLGSAENEFDVFLTTDKGIPHQHNLAGFDLAIVVLRAKSSDYDYLSPLMDEVNVALGSVVPGALLTVPTGDPS
jgi:hypothetical protein